MSSPALEAYLARLYTDASERERFLQGNGRPEGLTDAELAGLARIDLTGLAMAADSYAWKRIGRKSGAKKWIAPWRK